MYKVKYELLQICTILRVYLPVSCLLAINLFHVLFSLFIYLKYNIAGHGDMHLYY